MKSDTYFALRLPIFVGVQSNSGISGQPRGGGENILCKQIWWTITNLQVTRPHDPQFVYVIKLGNSEI